MRQTLFIPLLLALFFQAGTVFAIPFDAQDGVERLRKAIKIYENMKKGDDWVIIPGGKQVKINDKDGRLSMVRKRLAAEKYLAKSKSKSDVEDFFDGALDEALKKYQENHGLLADGELGKNTVASLNVPLENRICQLKANLMRMESSTLGSEPKYLMVNVPEYRLRAYEGEKEELSMRVITGQRHHQTPVFSDIMEYIVINPSWHVPRRIALNEELKNIKEDPEYLNRKGMKLIADAEAGGNEVDPSTIDWTSMSQETFNYRIVQKPGRGNALGTIKFIFPNSYDVYLHDTPNHKLFDRADRALSHGCVRVSEPSVLAEYVLDNDEKWNQAKVEAAVNSGVQKTLNLKEKLPVHLEYYTSWVDDDGNIHFRDDIYKKDVSLAKQACAE